MKHKGSVVLFIPIIVFGVAVFLGYVFLKNSYNQSDMINDVLVPHPSPTITPGTGTNVKRGWKIYQNDTQGYLVEHPEDWSVVEASARSDIGPRWTGDTLLEDQLQKVTFVENDYGTWQGALTVTVTKNLDNHTTSTWAEDFFVPLSADPGTNIAKNVGTRQINNKNAHVFEIFSFDHNEILYGLIHNQNLYTFVYEEATSNDDRYEEHKQIYEQMLASVKFLEPSDVTIYSCPENGWVDCIPGPDKDLSMCTPEADEWFRENCPDYQGFAY